MLTKSNKHKSIDQIKLIPKVSSPRIMTSTHAITYPIISASINHVVDSAM
jgi:hypothetical protein